jgi:hypothetical protein
LKLVTDKNESTSLASQIGSGGGDCFDLVLDDGSYLADALVFDGRAVGLIIGGQTGYISFSDVPQIRGHTISHSLRLRRYHSWPIIGRQLRHRWAQNLGVKLRHPDWRPKI